MALIQYLHLPLHIIVASSIVTNVIAQTTIQTTADSKEDEDSELISVHIAWIIGVGILLFLCTACLISLIIWQVIYVTKTRKELSEKMHEMTVQLKQIRSTEFPDHQIDGPSPDQNSTTSP